MLCELDRFDKEGGAWLEKAKLLPGLAVFLHRLPKIARVSRAALTWVSANNNSSFSRFGEPSEVHPIERQPY